MLFNIKNNDLVLEVGSGDFPSIFSDVLVDKHPLDNFQRNNNIWVDKRPLIAADAQRLPFRDGAFSYVIASNILPYVENPEFFFSELKRVAPRGVIVTISEIFERLRDIRFHKWYVNLVDGKLVLKKKEGSDRSFGKLFHILCEKDKYFFRFINKHWCLFNLTYQWEGHINYEIVAPSTKIIDLEDDDIVRKLVQDKRSKAAQIINFFISSRLKNCIISKFIKLKKRPYRVGLSDILACPACKRGVAIGKELIECKNCKKTYPIKNSIPYMFTDE